MDMRLSGARLVLALGGAALVLAACDGDGPSERTGIDGLGSDFVTAFDADPNSAAVDAQDVDLTLTPTIEPFDPS